MAGQAATPIKPALRFFSHGLKKGSPFPRADCYLDCRGVMEPKGIPGEDKKAQDLIRSVTDLSPYIKLIEQGISKLGRRRSGEPDPYARPFAVCCFCAWGLNRSPAMKVILSQEMFKRGYKVEVIANQYIDPFLTAENKPITTFKGGAEAFARSLSFDERAELEGAIGKIEMEAEREQAKTIKLTPEELDLIAKSDKDGPAISAVKARTGLPYSVVRWAIWEVMDAL